MQSLTCDIQVCITQPPALSQYPNTVFQTHKYTIGISSHNSNTQEKYQVVIRLC